MNRIKHSIPALIKKFKLLLFFNSSSANNFKKQIASLLTVSLIVPFLIQPIQVFAAMTYTYDANGNMSSDGTYCYTYNDANQVSQVKNCGNNQVIAQYIYDYQGNRIEKKLYTNGTLSKTVYTPDKSYETTKLANGSTQNTSYYYANDELVAKKNPDGTKNYYLSDNLHSTNVLTGQSGNVVENTTYYPFGDIRSGGTSGKYLYTGQQNDQETNLDYYNARYYNSHIRRFTQPDDVIANIYNPQGLNRYSYVNNNPLTYTDPSGHFFVLPLLFAGIGAAAGGGYENYSQLRTFATNTNQNLLQASMDPGFHRDYGGILNSAMIGAGVAVGASELLLGGQLLSGTSSLTPYEKGQAGVNLTKNGIRNEGGNVVGEEVSLDVLGPEGKIRLKTDLVSTGGKSGSYGFTANESKYGPSARLSKAQAAGYALMQKGYQVIPVGKNATKAGLEINVATFMNYRFWPWNTGK